MRLLFPSRRVDQKSKIQNEKWNAFPAASSFLPADPTSYA